MNICSNTEFGCCAKCQRSIEIPGLGHSFCRLHRWIPNSQVELAAATVSNEPAALDRDLTAPLARSKSAKRAIKLGVTSNSEQMNLFGGAA